MTTRPNRLTRFAFPLLLAGLAPAQEPPAAEDDLPARTQALIDEFIGCMPTEPTALRDPRTRADLTARTLPVLRRIRAFAADHPDTLLAERADEFVVYALVLDDHELGTEVAERAADGEPDATLLLHAAAAIQATTPTQRGSALAGVAHVLRAASPNLGAHLADSAVRCLVIAADLSEAEAGRLADSASIDRLAAPLRAHAERAARDPRLLLDKPFALQGRELDGAAFDSRSLAGKVVLIDFWATTCGPCVAGLPELVRLRETHGEAGLALVGVSCDSSEDRLRAFLEQHPDMDWPQLFGGEGSTWHPLATRYGVDRIPRLFLVDRKGVLRSVDAAKDLEATILRYLDG